MIYALEFSPTLEFANSGMTARKDARPFEAGRCPVAKANPKSCR